MRTGETFGAVKVPRKVGVDPCPLFDVSRLPDGVSFYTETSDEFFFGNRAIGPYDLVFLDGLHWWEQTYRDLLHALGKMSDRGIILLDDVMPDHFLSSLRDERQSIQARKRLGMDHSRWHGDVFIVLALLREFHPELDYVLIGNHRAGDNVQAIIWQTPQRYPANDRAEAEPAIEDIEFLAQEIEKGETLLEANASLFTPRMSENEGIIFALRSAGYLSETGK